ncbi:GNAT family N-acetyltransferase [Streptomyces solincola]|uniref:GNAT family N-acetyltransferase n=1 Tax=Streptomyces solincola TaxID=2100817 RepID=A0A2S9Q2U2_9ACTN|nr:GNAT family N-acetyltransferase [Streptomyces solincola]PRH80933.1 GNAT family N-acetyltransferase [Streptomyces solincola]
MSSGSGSSGGRSAGDWAADVDAAAAVCAAALEAVAERDWEVAATGLEWSCQETAVHIAGDFTGYAAQLTGRMAQGYVPFDVVAVPGTGPQGLVRIVRATGGLLSAAVRTTPADLRAWHPAGPAGGDGFAAMGIAEVLLHTHDIVTALGGQVRPEGGLCARVLDRLFPHAPRAAGDDPWRVLLHVTGRAEGPGGEPAPTAWRWYCDPVRSARLVLCELSPPAAADLHSGGSGGFTWADGGPEEGTRFAGGMVAGAAADGSHRPGWGTYVIVRAEDGRAVGGIGFHAPPGPDGEVEAGYDVVASARGHGYAAEALAALAGWAFTDPDLTAVRATVDHPNAASHAVVARAGFHRASADETQVHYEMRRPKQPAPPST